MAAKRCTRCDTSYGLEVIVCETCGGTTWTSETHYPDDLGPADRALTAEAWRLHVLIEAGYPVEVAEQLASRRDVDLHQAAELPARGCPPETAARILL